MAEPLSFELKTALGTKLRFLQMEGSEEISRGFRYEVLCSAEVTETIKFDDLLGTPAQVNVKPEKGATRIYHGIVIAAAQVGMRQHRRAYSLTIAPKLWLATRSSNVRIFQKLTVIDIVKKVLDAYAIGFDAQVSPMPRAREYCVQYRESDFDFVSRLLEEEGIFYFFQHAEGQHKLVLSNRQSSFQPMFGLDKMTYRDDPRTVAHSGAVTRWNWREQIRTGKVTLWDHCFELPSERFDKKASAQRKHAAAAIEAYDYPAPWVPYADDKASVLSGDIQALAARRLEERQADYARSEGDAHTVHQAAGARFKLDGHPLAEQNTEYVVLSTRVAIAAADLEAGPDNVPRHDQSFVAFPNREAFRPARQTRRPTVAGLQTATVVGPSGEEIFTDKYGRVKVQFHWDREGKKNQDSSCWLRVAHAGAGKGFGTMLIPRIGWEVIVDFLEGDPDRPIVTGCVYNADNMPPYELPANKTVTTLKTRSTPSGGAADYNELRFEDKKGSEYVFFHSQKDRKDEIENDMAGHIGQDEVREIGRDSTLTIGKDQAISVGKNSSESVGDNLQQTVGKNATVTIGEAHALGIGKDQSVDVGMSQSVNVGMNGDWKIGQNLGVEGGMNVHVKAGMNLVLEAGMQLTLKAGASSIVIGPDGVSITGTPFAKINSGGAAGSGSGAKPKKPAKATEAKKAAKLEDPLQGKHH